MHYPLPSSFSKMRRSYFQAEVAEFQHLDDAAILGELTLAHTFTLENQQRDAWLSQIRVVRKAVQRLAHGLVVFEFVIPRMGKRADVVVVLPTAIVVIEFKVGASSFDANAVEQAHDYALDLKNFHAGSHNVPIVPVLCATLAPSIGPQKLVWDQDDVARPLRVTPDELGDLLEEISKSGGTSICDAAAWATSGYKPTPTIIEAARALYQNHGVEEITRSDAGAQNLNATTRALEEIIEQSKANRQKSICFVTGVPGAGKTLAGLNIATIRDRKDKEEHAVFLSGNGPLVDVIREALSRDDLGRNKQRASDAHRRVGKIVQNIHHFRDDALRTSEPPIERVVVFDEAQRAWTQEQAAKFMKTKKKVPDFSMSEPEFLISVMDRHESWCVVICLIGGGQEINTGEAGLSEWISSLNRSFGHWHVYISDRLSNEDYPAVPFSDKAILIRDPRLHLAVSMRSFRAETLSELVGHLVHNRPREAKAAYAAIAARYPIYLTRDLETARSWLRSRARGSERFGLLASSGARRLRPEGIHMKAKVDPPLWFLNPRSDVRSSYYCEEVASEFDVQGLELDWAAICWDADFRYGAKDWSSYRFKGTQWQQVRSPEARSFLRNAYRVLLTRARQGMIIFVPKGDPRDPTRPPSYYDHTFAFLRECGIPLARPTIPFVTDTDAFAVE